MSEDRTMKTMRVTVVSRDYCVGMLDVTLNEDAVPGLEEELTETSFTWQGGYEGEGETVRVFFTGDDGAPITVLNGTEWRTLEERGMTDWFYRMIFDGALAEARDDLRRIVTAALREKR